jgi:hydrogenase maturation protein HypF
MPGGAAASREPWRNLYAQLVRAFDWAGLLRRFGGLDVVVYLAAKPLGVLDRMIAGGINSPPASSCGRLFDAIAAVLGLCRDRQAYEGEAAMRLEAIVDQDAVRRGDGYRFALPPSRAIDPAPIWPRLLHDLANGVPSGVIAARFHAGLADAVAEMAGRLAEGGVFDTVALSGGCFQNAVLFEETRRQLELRGFAVLSHSEIPANDGGLALGQAAVAAARMIGKGAGACA